MHKKILVGLGLICMCLLALTPLANAVGVGVSPASLSYEEVLRGGTAQEYFTISNTADVDVSYDVRAEGEKSDWLSFDPVPPVKVPAKGKTKVSAIVKPPADTPDGIYRCIISVEPISANVTGEGAVVGILPSVAIGASIEITGEQVLAGEVYWISVENNEIGKPVRFSIGFTNAGNVRVEPEIDIDIFKEDKAIDKLKKSEEVIPGESKEIVTEWTGKDLGGYNAKVSVLLAGDLLSQRDLKFDVLERGTLTCKGEIVEVKAPEEVGVGKPAKIEVGFKNTGVVALEAKIKGDVILNLELVNVIESDSVLIEVGKTEILTAYLNPQDVGEHLIDGNVIYEGKKAKISQITISAKSVEGEEGGAKIPEFWALIVVISGLALIAAIISIFIVRRKLKKT